VLEWLHLLELLSILAEKNKVMAKFESSDWVYIIGIIAIVYVVHKGKKKTENEKRNDI